MKQATGKIKRAETENKVSIQLKLGGHSFSIATLPVEVANGSCRAEFVVLTAKTLLIPHEVFDPMLAANYLRIAGMECSMEEQPVWSDPQAPIIALMAADTACISGLRQNLGDRIEFTSPLLAKYEYSAPTLRLQQIDTLLYIIVGDSILRLAEVVPITTKEDLIFYVEQLSKLFPLQKFEALISGDNPRETSTLLRHYFQKTICE